MRVNITQDNATSVATDLAQQTVVQNPGSATASYFSAALGAATEGYKEYVRYDADKKTNQVNSLLDEDLQAIETAQAAGEEALAVSGARISSAIQELADNHPELSSLAKDMSTLDTAIMQRKGAKLLHSLRGEAALKSTLRKAPGLRKEVTAIAARNLGFDPTSATINAILRGIDSEKLTGNVNAEEDKLRWHYFTKLGENGFTLSGDQFATMPTNKMAGLLADVQNTQGKIEGLSAAIESKEVEFKTGLAQLAQQHSNLLSQQVSPLIESAIDISSVVSDEESFLQFNTDLKSQLNRTRNLISKQLYSTYTGLATDAESRKAAEEAANSVLEQVDVLFSGFTDADSPTAFQNNAKSLQTLKESLGVDMITSAKVLARLEAISPGMSSNLSVQILASDAEKYTNLTGILRDELNSLDGTDPRRKKLGNSIKVLENYRSFSSLTDGEKKDTAKTMSKWLDGYLKIYEENPDVLTEMDYKTAANSIAGYMQLSSDFATADWAKAALKGTTKGYQHLITELSKGDDESKHMAKLLSSEFNEAAINYVARGWKGEVEDFMEFSLDLTSGEVTNNSRPGGGAGHTGDSRPNPARLGKMIWHGDPHNFDRAAVRARDNLQSMIDTVYKNREMDPSLKDLTKGQIAHLLTSSLRGLPGLTLVGKPAPYRIETPEEKKKINIQDAIATVEAGFNEISKGVRTGSLKEASKEIEDELAAITEQTKELRKAKENIETDFHLSKGSVQ